MKRWVELRRRTRSLSGGRCFLLTHCCLSLAWVNCRPRNGSNEGVASICSVASYMSAHRSHPRLLGSDACMEFSPRQAPWGCDGQKKRETLSSSFFVTGVFLVNCYSLVRFWGCLQWVLCIGGARHPGPHRQIPVKVEVFLTWAGGGWRMKFMLVVLTLIF